MITTTMLSTGDCVAYVIPDEDLITKAETKSLGYAELAALRQRALAGDASAEIALSQLPAGEQRLADMLVKSFSGKKPRKQKKSVVKSAKPVSKAAIRENEAFLRSLLASDNPAEREMARAALGV
jgi:hypothetical protein